MKKKNPQYRFNPGDLVQIKSGGRAMTVELVLPFKRKVHPGVGYLCCWHNKNFTLERAELSEEVLVPLTRLVPLNRNDEDE